MKLQFVGSKNREGDAREFVFRPTAPFSWKAGQYLHYTLPHEQPDDRGIKRWFTISAAPSEGEVRITTRINREHSSSFKQALQALRPGDEIEAEGPEGDFVVSDPARNYVFIVGGIGITPVRSILTEAAAQGLQLHATLLYANRNQDVVFRDELESLRARNPRLKIQYVIEPDMLSDELLKTTIAGAENPLVYVSGPEPMVKAMSAQLEGLGVKQDNIRSDDFPGYDKI